MLLNMEIPMAAAKKKTLYGWIVTIGSNHFPRTRIYQDIHYVQWNCCSTATVNPQYLKHHVHLSSYVPGGSGTKLMENFFEARAL